MTVWLSIESRLRISRNRYRKLLHYILDGMNLVYWPRPLAIWLIISTDATCELQHARVAGFALCIATDFWFRKL